MVYNGAMPPDYPQQTPPSHPASYDFIMNPAAPPKKPLLPSGSNLAVRIGLVAGGLLVLLILFSIVKSLVVQSPDLTGFVVIAQDQQELIHLVSNTASNGQSGLSSNNKNLAATAQLSLSSNQSRVLQYLAANHKKVRSKDLNLKLSSTLDNQLANAQTAGTYDSTFQSIIASQLKTYISDLSSTYRSSSAKQQKGRALLKSLYAQASLLQNQVGSTGN